jgi:phosphoglycolate phosphatase
LERYIIWDVDGTVVDTRRAIAQSYLYALKHVGVEESDGTRVYPFVGRRSTLVFSECHGLSGEPLAAAIAAYQRYFEKEGIELCALYPGMGELLSVLRGRGARMSVASARSHRQLTMLFDRLRIGHAFDCVFATETDHKAADKPKLVGDCIAFMGASPQDCVMVGDRIYDIEGGQKAGTRAIGVTYGFGTREELHACAPEHIVDDVDALAALLLGDKR